MRYTGHKSVNGVQILDNGSYYAAIYSSNPNIARIETDRDSSQRDHTTYSDAAGNITYELSVFKIRLYNGRVRRI